MPVATEFAQQNGTDLWSSIDADFRGDFKRTFMI